MVKGRGRYLRWHLRSKLPHQSNMRAVWLDKFNVHEPLYTVDLWWNPDSLKQRRSRELDTMIGLSPGATGDPPCTGEFEITKYDVNSSAVANNQIQISVTLIPDPHK
ncbi:hypothetical protein TNCV_4922131 [Trichonephila clavipes]|nr:hypothetical protein TNCV_4922131 [Trichonephila clavipes]